MGVGVPIPTLTHAKFALKGTVVADMSLSVTGKGTLEIYRDNSAQSFKLATVPGSDVPPIVIEPSVGLDATISASLALATQVEAKDTITVEADVG